MADSTYSINRAQEIFMTALEKKELNRWQSDLRKITSLTKDATLLKILESPGISFDDKAKVLSERLVEINPKVMELVAELISKNRLTSIDEISDEYQRLVDNYHGIEGAEVAEITTAIELEDEEKLKIAQRITSIIGKPVVLKANVDASLIGGIIINVGDKLIDGSIRSKLQVLKREMGTITK